ncbi:MAG: hypothetical protein KA768_08180 [Desulfobulbus sp.]|nr:hypothetical protein [Desulfobulbus sp.]
MAIKGLLYLLGLLGTAIGASWSTAWLLSTRYSSLLSRVSAIEAEEVDHDAALRELRGAIRLETQEAITAALKDLIIQSNREMAALRTGVALINDRLVHVQNDVKELKGRVDRRAPEEQTYCPFPHPLRREEDLNAEGY